MASKHLQWQEDYNFDSLYDMQRDIIESFDKRFNPNAAEPPTDENGIFPGVYRVTIEYIPEENPEEELKKELETNGNNSV